MAATYVGCSPVEKGLWEKETKKRDRTATCLQCEDSPTSLVAKDIQFSVSLTGDFSDVISSKTFVYYK